MYVSQKDDGTIFMVNLITFLDDKNRDPQEILDGLVDDVFLSNPKNELLKKEKEDYLSYPSTHFAIKDNDVTITGKAFVANKTLYVLTTVADATHAKFSDLPMVLLVDFRNRYFIFLACPGHD